MMYPRGRRPSKRHRVFAHLYFLQRLWEPAGLARHRRAVARGVTGRTLEIGIGTGFSLSYYDQAPFVGCDPNITMLRKARRRARRLGMPTVFAVARGEALPFHDAAFDTVVSEVVFCSVESPETVAQEVRRVLSAGGHLRCVEHGIASRPAMAAVQRILTPVWRRLFGGCRLDRDVVSPLLAAGLEPDRVRRCSAGSVVRVTMHAAPTAEVPDHSQEPEAKRW